MTINAVVHPRVVAQDQGPATTHGDRIGADSMRLNPMFDPFAEADYLGYSLRGIAHRRRNRTYRASLAVRDYRYGTGEVLYECLFPELFFDADTAINCAMGKGHEVIDDLLESVNCKERINISRSPLWIEPA